MKLYDEYSVKDLGYTPKGIVKLLDDNGNIIFEKHNLVVNNGRELMYALFLNYFKYTDNLNSDNNEILNKILNNGQFTPLLEIYLSFDDQNMQTTPEINLASIEQNIYYVEKYTSNNLDNIVLDETERSITFNISFTVNPEFLETAIPNSKAGSDITFKSDSSESFRFNQIYITYQTDTDNRFLFSRVAMDPVFLGIGMKYQLEYSLYF